MPYSTPAKEASYQKKWYAKNRKARLAQDKVYRQKNVERIKADAHVRRITKWGITVIQYEQLLQAQDGVCGICKGPPTGNGRYHIDHDHVTKEIRGLLCRHCNAVLGYARDSVTTLERAVAYLCPKIGD